MRTQETNNHKRLNSLLTALSVLFVLMGTSLYSQVTYSYGKFTGTGSAYSIAGLGFSPDAIILKSENANGAYFATDDMSGGAKLLSANTALTANVITNWGANGFTVGTGSAYNASSVETHWVAWDDAGDVSIGTYTGAGGASSVTGMGFSPDMLIVVGDGTSDGERAFFGNRAQATGTGFLMQNGSNTPNMVSLDADGFSDQGTSEDPDNSGVDYYYIAINSGADSEHGGYNPGGSGDKTITTSWQPDFVITRGVIDGRDPVWRTASMDANESAGFLAETMLSGTGIQSFGATSFVVDDNVRVSDDWNEHDFFATKGGSEVLPIELLSFDVTVEKNNQVAVKWTTATEINNDYFEVHRSTNGTDFETIATIDGAGDSFTPLDYQFYDTNAPQGVVYYRIKQVDYDGMSETFKIKNVFIGSSQNVSWVHTSVDNKQQIRLYGELEGSFDVKILSINGKTIHTESINAQNGLSSADINLPENVSKGVYVVNIQGSFGYVTSGKFMVK